MSGHSKWKTIKRQKGANDAKRGQAFTKLSMAITLAVKQGGGIGDPNKNFKLRLAVDAARAVNMPKDTIERAIERASGKQQDEMEEVHYEGFGPGGVSVMVDAITDKKQRTTPEIKSLFDKNGGVLGNPGTVAYQFQQVGQIILEKPSMRLDDIFLLAADTGAEDVIQDGEDIVIYTKPEDLSKVSDALQKNNLTVSESAIIQKPTIYKELLTQEEADKFTSFIEKIEDHQDVQNVFHNANFVSDIPV